MTDQHDEPPVDDGYRDPDIDGCVHCRVPEDCDECEDERARDKVIETLVVNLHLFVSEARANVARADGSLRELTADHVYDIELAEGDGPDLLEELAAADRHLRNAYRIAAERKRLLKADGR